MVGQFSYFMALLPFYCTGLLLWGSNPITYFLHMKAGVFINSTCIDINIVFNYFVLSFLKIRKSRPPINQFFSSSISDTQIGLCDLLYHVYRHIVLYHNHISPILLSNQTYQPVSIQFKFRAKVTNCRGQMFWYGSHTTLKVLLSHSPPPGTALLNNRIHVYITEATIGFATIYPLYNQSRCEAMLLISCSKQISHSWCYQKGFHYHREGLI